MPAGNSTKSQDITKTDDGKTLIPRKIHKFDPDTMPFNEGKFGHEEMAGGLNFYKPNFKVRITEKMAELAQDELLTYLQTYMNKDYKFSPEGQYDIDMFPIFTTLKYENL